MNVHKYEIEIKEIDRQYVVTIHRCGELVDTAKVCRFESAMKIVLLYVSNPTLRFANGSPI